MNRMANALYMNVHVEAKDPIIRQMANQSPSPSPPVRPKQPELQYCGVRMVPRSQDPDNVVQHVKSKL